ncbi:MAG: hypothetical protein J7M08_01345 [Planctomycetes bacterium]|nr:hypothetical protein [Planctomycetota bacterium]
MPESYARQLGQAARETGTAIEINGDVVKHPDFSERFLREYMEFLSIVAEEGARFSVGSDVHEIGTLRKTRHAWEMAERLNLTKERIWRPECAPFAGGESL